MSGSIVDFLLMWEFIKTRKLLFGILVVGLFALAFFGVWSEDSQQQFLISLGIAIVAIYISGVFFVESSKDLNAAQERLREVNQLQNKANEMLTQVHTLSDKAEKSLEQLDEHLKVMSSMLNAMGDGSRKISYRTKSDSGRTTFTAHQLHAKAEGSSSGSVRLQKDKSNT